LKSMTPSLQKIYRRYCSAWQRLRFEAGNLRLECERNPNAKALNEITNHATAAGRVARDVIIALRDLPKNPVAAIELGYPLRRNSTTKSTKNTKKPTKRKSLKPLNS